MDTAGPPRPASLRPQYCVTRPIPRDNLGGEDPAPACGRAALAPDGELATSKSLRPRYHAEVVHFAAVERRLASRARPVELEVSWP